MEKAIADKAAVQKQLGVYTAQAADAQKKIEEANAEQMRLSKRLTVLAPSPTKAYFRDAPLLDFMAPTLKVQQIILPNVVDDVNFIRVPKMDRCQTCHLAIDKKGYEKYPAAVHHPPGSATFLGGSSAHPIDKTGCTVCHEGHGAVGQLPRRGAHAEQREAEGRVGEEVPLGAAAPVGLPDAAAEDDRGVVRQVPQAAGLHPEGRRTSTSPTRPTSAPAATPATRPRASTPTCASPGRSSPRSTRSCRRTGSRTGSATRRRSSRRPGCRGSSTTRTTAVPEDAVRNEAEINGIAAYLFANAEKHELAVKNPGHGDAKRGEEIVKQIGCQGCHVVGEGSREAAGPRRTFGQPLENIGNKTTYEWIYNWVRDPKHYSPATYMPNLRLTDAQVADVATYLVGLKGPAGDPAKATPDAKVVDDVLLDYLKNVMPFEDAKAQIAKMNPQQKQVELGQRAISRYGCFSCHDIKGFEKAQSIGTDLSEEGSKLVTRLDFAFIEDIPHTSKLGWFKTKLHDPRIFDKGRVLQPLDKLRMPNFDLSDVENERLLTAIMSFQREIQPPAAMPVKTANRRLHLRRPDARAPPQLRRLPHHRRRRRRLPEAGRGSVARSADADAGRRARAARLALRVPARADHDPSVAERPDADLRPRRSESERRDPLLRRDLEHDRAVPDARAGHPHGVDRRQREGAVRPAEVPAVPRARRDPQGSADVEPGARSAHGLRAAAAANGSSTG